MEKPLWRRITFYKISKFTKRARIICNNNWIFTARFTSVVLTSTQREFSTTVFWTLTCLIPVDENKVCLISSASSAEATAMLIIAAINAFNEATREIAAFVSVVLTFTSAESRTRISSWDIWYSLTVWVADWSSSLCGKIAA